MKSFWPSFLRRTRVQTPEPDVAQIIDDELAVWKERLRQVPISQLPAFSRRMRSQMPWWFSDYGFGVKRLASLLGSVTDPVTLAQLASIHPNGYCRETAVKRLGDEPNLDQSVPWLLLRCNDWVPEVRDCALRIFEQAVERERVSYKRLAEAVSLLPAGAHNNKASYLVEKITNGLLAETRIGLLVDVVRSEDAGASRKAAELLLAVKPALEVLSYAQPMDAVTIRTIAKKAFSNPAICESAALEIANNKNASLRADALWHLVSHAHEVPVELLDAGLRDPVSLVRDVSQRYASTIGYDLHDYYSKLATADPAAALAGLGDIGSAADLTTALGFAKSPSTKVRSASLRVVASFGNTEQTPLLIHHAITDTGAPARQAIRGLVRLGIRPDVADDFWSELVKGGDEVGWRRFFRRVLPKAPRWVAIESALRGCDNDNPAVRTLAVVCVESVLSRVGESHLLPSSSAIPELRCLLLASANALPKSAITEITAELDRT